MLARDRWPGMLYARWHPGSWALPAARADDAVPSVRPAEYNESTPHKAQPECWAPALYESESASGSTHAAGQKRVATCLYSYAGVVIIGLEVSEAICRKGGYAAQIISQRITDGWLSVKNEAIKFPPSTRSVRTLERDSPHSQELR